MMREAVADSKAYAEVRHQAEEEEQHEEEYEYVSQKEVAALDAITGSDPAPVPVVATKSSAERSFDHQRRRAIRMAEQQLKKRLNEERKDAKARAEKKAQEDQLLTTGRKAPSYGFSNIKAGLKLQDYQESHRRLGAVAAATAAAGIVLIAEEPPPVSHPPLPYYMTMGSETRDASGRGAVDKEISTDSQVNIDSSPISGRSLSVTISGGAVDEPLTDDEEEEGEDLQHQHQRRLRREAAQQQSDVREAISDNLIDQRFGWHRNYHSGNSAQHAQVEVTSGSLPPTAKSTPKASLASPMSSSGNGKKGGTSLLGKLPQPTSLPPLALLPRKVSVSTITSNDAPEFVYHLRKRLSCEQLQFDLSLSGGQQRMDSDSLDGVSLSGSHAGSSSTSSSSHYRIVSTNTAHLPKASRLESIPDNEEAPQDSLSSLLDGERRAQLLEQLKRSVYVDPSREISWRLAGTLKEGPKYGSSRPHFEMDVFEHSMNLRTGKLLNAYRPWSHVKTDDFDFDHFQAVMQEAAVTERDKKVLAPINSPKQPRGHRGGKKNLYGGSSHKKSQHSNSGRSLHQQSHQQNHAQTHPNRLHSEEALPPLRGSPNKAKTCHHSLDEAHHSISSTHSSKDSTTHDHEESGEAVSRCNSFLSDTEGEEQTSPASKAIGRRHQKHSLPIIINVIKVVPV
jgi:hypothetical protein